MEYPRDSPRSPQKYLLTVSDLSSLDPAETGFLNHDYDLQLRLSL